MDIITRLEEIILISIWKLKDNAYGVTINEEVSQKSGKNYSMGALYFTLDQMFKKGLIFKSVGEPTAERGGRSKIYYTLTPEGKKALNAVRALQASLWDEIPDYVFGEEKE